MKKLNKIFSIVLTAAIMTSLLITSAVPVSAATQAWSNFATPSTTGMVTNTSILGATAFAQSPVDGALYASVNDAGTPKLLKSTDGGRTWKSITTAVWTAAAVAIVPSATEANVVFVATAAFLYKSLDGGVTFTTIVGAPAGDAITALDVSMFGGRYVAVVGTDAAFTGIGVFFWDANDIFNNLNPVGTTTFGFPVLALNMAPTFAVDRAVVAVGDNGANAIVRVNVNGGAWGATVLDTVITSGVPTAADIGFPTDFNATTNPIYFVVVSGPTGGAFRMVGNTFLSIDAGLTWNNIAVNGAFNAGVANVMLGSSAGTVKKSTNSGVTFSAVTLRSADTTQTAWVLFDYDYANSKKAFVLNPGTAGTTGALNVSIDSMGTFNQWSLVNETIAVITDLAIASNGDMFMVTNGANLWRYFGATWERVKVGATGNMVRVSPNYATDKAVFYTTSTSPAAIMVSSNSANSFAAMTTAPGSFDGIPNPVFSFIPLTNSTVVVGDNAGKLMVNTSAFFWTETSVFGAGYTVTDIKAAGTALYAVAQNGAMVKAAMSADNGATWSVLKAVGAPTSTDASITTASINAFIGVSNGNVFVAVDGGTFRFVAYSTATPTGFKSLSTSVTPVSGLAVGPGTGNADEGNGIVYVSDSNTVLVDRIRGTMAWSENTLPTTGLTTAPAAVTGITKLFAASNVLWVVGDDAKIYSYTDTLNAGITGVAASNIVSTTSIFLGIVTTTNTASIAWAAMPNATGYTWAVDTTKVTDLSAAGAALLNGTTTTALKANLTGLAADTTYYVSVWADAPVSSFMGNGSFTTVIGTPTPAMNLAPAAGAIDVPVKPTFDWADVPGAVSYDVWVDTKTDFSTAQKFTTPISAYAFTGTLANNTAYYWQVRAVTGTGTSGWVTSVFTTVAAAPPVVTVTSTTPASTSIVLTVPTTETPSYIWIIIGVGGLLTILVIVLIVRTRRVV